MSYFINTNNRKGKTQKDLNSGSTARNQQNKREREAWFQAQGMLPSTMRGKNFPVTTCNGKKNHHRYTGKGNITVICGKPQ